AAPRSSRPGAVDRFNVVRLGGRKRPAVLDDEEVRTLLLQRGPARWPEEASPGAGRPERPSPLQRGPARWPEEAACHPRRPRRMGCFNVVRLGGRKRRRERTAMARLRTALQRGPARWPEEALPS